MGDAVTSTSAGRNTSSLRREICGVSREVQPLSVYLAALGMTSMTVWAGLNLVEVKAGDVIYIAGAVGKVAGQLAKLRSCRVIGAAGSMENAFFCRTNASSMSPSITMSARSLNN